MGQKTALITGITGQDGSYLAEFLLEKGYVVHGIKRRASSFNTDRIDHLYSDPHQTETRFFLHYGDLTDSLNITRLLQEIQPDEIYHLGAMSHVKVSFDMPEYTANADGLGTLRLLEAVRLLGMGDRVRFYQASTSELYGLAQEFPQNEDTPFHPRSPYGVAKLFAYWTTVNYREAYGIYGCNGILFNHESPRRGETFVSRKISMAVAAIARGRQNRLYLGNLDALRDWGHAKDYVEAMWLMLQQPEPHDLVVATGIETTVRNLAEMAFSEIGISLEFRRDASREQGFIAALNTPIFEERVGRPPHAQLVPGAQVIAVDPNYYRPAEVPRLCGDASRARNILGWSPRYDVRTMIGEMVQSDLRVLV